MSSKRSSRGASKGANPGGARKSKRAASERGEKAAARTKSASASRRTASEEKKPRRRLAQWLQLGLFAPPAPPPPERTEIRVPARLRKAIPDQEARRLA